MAHHCPICGSLCHCNGDLDDVCLDIEEDILKCVCCIEEDEDESDYDIDDDDDYERIYDLQEDHEPVYGVPHPGCSCSRSTDEYHGWECTITEGACMFLSPDSKQCAKEYGEGPDAKNVSEEDGDGQATTAS